MKLYGGIEAGGTKFVCAVGTGPGDLRAVTRFATTTPAETIGRAIDFFRSQSDPITAIGIGAFGPVDPNQASPTYGYVTTTPKPGWQQTDLLGPIKQAFGVPVAFDTDVNAAVIGEARWGAAQNLENALYITVGTGIGGGAIVDGRPVHGLLHAEIGHIPMIRDPQADPFGGVCPYHGDCLEGLAAGPALAARWGQRGDTLPVDHPAWPLEARYLALGIASCIYTLAPQRIILGGGVMQQAHLFPLVRAEVRRIINGYLQVPELLTDIDQYIVPPGLGSEAGVLGTLAMAQQIAP